MRFPACLPLACLALSAPGLGQSERAVNTVASSGEEPIVEEAYLEASNPDLVDLFGSAVAVHGDTAVVGAWREDGGASGVNGDQDDNSAFDAGAAYVFVRDGTGWVQQAYLKASNPDGGTIIGTGDNFGIGVAIYGDTLVVGANGESSSAAGVNGDQSDNSLQRSGAAYVFVRDGTNWVQEAYLKASNPDANDRFGSHVAIHGDTIVVGVTQEDSAATGVNGDQSDNSAMDAGAVYIFRRAGTTWSQEAYIKASNADAIDFFGRVALWGDTLVVGAYQERSAADEVNGDESDNSELFAGAAYVFTRSGTTWSQEAYLKGSRNNGLNRFGSSVSVFADRVAVGALGQSSAYVFVRKETGWEEEAFLLASNRDSGDHFGTYVGLYGNALLAGAPREDGPSEGINNGLEEFDHATWSGAAYLFERDGTDWGQTAYIKASDARAFSGFGRVTLWGDTAVIAASNHGGIDSPGRSGAAYVFRVRGPECVTLDFETEDDFETPAVNGQDISTPPEFGNLVAIRADGPGHHGPAIFDSDPSGPNALGGDRDLLVDLGNILILQEDPTQTVPGIFDHPDDPWFGGTLIFDFTTPVELRSVDLIDICPGPPVQDVTLTLVDQELRLRTYFVPGGWTGDVASTGPPGFGTLDLTTLEPQPGYQTTATASEDRGFDPSGVIAFEVFFLSSGGLDNLELCPQSAGLRPVRKRVRFPVPVRGPRRK